MRRPNVNTIGFHACASPRGEEPLGTARCKHRTNKGQGCEATNSNTGHVRVKCTKDSSDRG
eukprot:3302343-Prymnesium_polylepis.1